jgi:hypothetical protein
MIQDGHQYHCRHSTDDTEHNKINCPFGTELGHKISKGSVKRFKSYRDLKNPRWPPACGRRPVAAIFDFLRILKL